MTALAAGAGGFFARGWFPANQDASHPGAGTAPPGRPAQVVARGRLEPGTEIIAVGLPAGSQVARLAVREGDWVEKDTPLAYLDSYGEMAAARDSANAQLREADKRLRAETDYGEASVEAARLRIRQADEVALLAIQAQDAEVRRSQAEMEKAQLDLRRSRQMLDDKAVAQSHYDNAALIARQAEEQFQRNKVTLAQLKLDREIKLRLARAELRSAEAGSLRGQLAAQVGSLTEALKVAEARRDRAVIRAPVPGQILKILTHAGEAAGREPLLKMGDTHAMYAVAEVYETDVRFVRPGQKATATSKAFPDTLTGEVERVSVLVHRNDVLAIDPAADADARVVEVRVRLHDSSVASRYNQLQVDVAIHTGGQGETAGSP
jgi:HlyD family secretion protein